MRVLNKIKSLISKRVLILSTIIFVTFIVFINLLSARLTSGINAQVLDFTFLYSDERAFEILNVFGPIGRKMYLNILFIDFLFPISYMFFGVSLLSVCIKTLTNKDGALSYIILMPILGMLFDWLENIMIITMIRQFPVINPAISIIANISTILKFTFTGGTLLVAAGLFLMQLGNKYMKKR